jgi:hypothetical protein
VVTGQLQNIGRLTNHVFDDAGSFTDKLANERFNATFATAQQRR